MGDLRSGGIPEENLMAIIDTSGLKDSQDVADDELAFLESVRAISIVPEEGPVPTRKMYDAIFKIFTDKQSLELIMGSYLLLCDLEKIFPRVYLTRSDKCEPCTSSIDDFVVVPEAWSPFLFGPENVVWERESTSAYSVGLVDSSKFLLITHDVAEALSSLQSMDIKSLGTVLLFQYLVRVIEDDFLPRCAIYKDTEDWTILRESLLNQLLGSRRLSFKTLVRDCLCILTGTLNNHGDINHYDQKKSQQNLPRDICDHDVFMPNAVTELVNATYASVRTFISMIMELDTLKNEASMSSRTSRTDGLRTPLLEIILDELTYSKELLFPFLQGFSEAKWKMEIILRYIWKYCGAFSVQTRSSTKSLDDRTLGAVLKLFSNEANSKKAIRKISIQVVLMLLSHGFQAYLSLHQDWKYHKDHENSVAHISKSLILAFRNLQIADGGHHAIMLVAKRTFYVSQTALALMPLFD
ncbi:negative regulator of systemic acquired resistance SNI1 isoform X2 [Amborella trichopoda]|uniref:negative regulator of systemic acquired resistance SNI1 isoform X2 n=1 Tax=Amborella trichopoda TaxID=13333 RepID=UPI0009C0227B|nr:negative regulator of systemic acquired resistance SNI1 isoform X2 [Amborella trichopoda]|eukprot:XP_020527805.1 negative regulator of systemic acquired resistance SNI1 isoform X2 [Amborella trichopoda]